MFSLNMTQKKSLEDLVKCIGDGSNVALQSECVEEGVKRIMASSKIKEDDVTKIAAVEKVWISTLLCD